MKQGLSALYLFINAEWAVLRSFEAFSLKLSVIVIYGTVKLNDHPTSNLCVYLKTPTVVSS